ncbi:hypothetical protein MTBBW1_80095 [Desulfamplus magnetovallimortis]|uniref:Uncharacterized protein n=1 Tax=Desulfamplus magnetovallimortis TaxID=1246637 RepID=L0R3X5_9BACT|nr:hypothetical protein [Desulfamplus magnetovallimortis]CCO06703.1 hypothetical protein DEMABW1_80095 [Desulfamplus magnetovallimortis BW-1]SLM32754.1 hypothetical protein MTBBW1_80095 [Desulfamplus magnetovallimortis]
MAVFCINQHNISLKNKITSSLNYPTTLCHKVSIMMLLCHIAMSRLRFTPPTFRKNCIISLNAFNAFNAFLLKIIIGNLPSIFPEPPKIAEESQDYCSHEQTALISTQKRFVPFHTYTHIEINGNEKEDEARHIHTYIHTYIHTQYKFTKIIKERNYEG